MIDGEEKLEFDTGCTQRGFGTIGFRDLYGQYCGFQMSSIATAECIWFGVDKVPVNLNEPDGPTKPVDSGRMHLNREQAKQLADILMNFYETGELFLQPSMRNLDGVDPETIKKAFLMTVGVLSTTEDYRTREVPGIADEMLALAAKEP